MASGQHVCPSPAAVTVLEAVLCSGKTSRLTSPYLVLCCAVLLPWVKGSYSSAVLLHWVMGSYFSANKQAVNNGYHLQPPVATETETEPSDPLQ